MKIQKDTKKHLYILFQIASTKMLPLKSPMTKLQYDHDSL